jgi:hypothetical protein
MLKEPRQVVVTDPRSYDGNPYDVAQRAAAQAEGLLNITRGSVEDATVMARNAEMERQCIDGGAPDANAWEASAAGRKWAALAQTLWQARNDLVALGRAAAFDPKHPEVENGKT